ncbi:hypothetical protein HK102_009888, partial [Quaeritorhiza haematococci]
MEKDKHVLNMGILNYQYNMAKTYIVGNGTRTFEVWVPWANGEYFDGKPFVFASALVDLITSHPSSDIKGKISVVGWDAVTSRRICNESSSSSSSSSTDNNNNNTLPCPDIVIVGTTQVSGRYYRGEVEPLDRYFEMYNEETGTVLQDEFVKASYYDYRV